MDVCFTDRFNFFIIVPHNLPQFFFSAFQLSFTFKSFYAMQSGFFSYALRQMTCNAAFASFYSG